jgi:YVTN family beta-propeller protein
MKNSARARFLNLAGLCLLGLAALIVSGSLTDTSGETRALSAVEASAASDHFYIGVAGCRRCHDGDEGRSGFGAWYLSAHARAYAALSMPQAEEIARLSGIDTDVFASPICLGCHSTAPDAEAWELDPSFFREDGVQCELCHGPGSDYADARTMADPAAARRAGLSIPGKTFCMRCHQPKGSHQAVLKVKEFDYESFLKRIRHPGKGKVPNGTPGKTGAFLNGPQYAGAMACARCHTGEAKGYAFGRWRLSPHANAYFALQGSKAGEIAAREGVEGDPIKSTVCLRCHTTGYGGASGRLLPSFLKEMGVQCEACHGPGSGHIDRAGQEGAIIAKPDRTVCGSCHNGRHGRTFRYEPMRDAIEHSVSAARSRGGGRPQYKTPVNLALSRDGRRLYVTCEASDSVVVVDTRDRAVHAEIRVGSQPNGVCLSPDERRAYVSNRGSDTVSVIDLQKNMVIDAIHVGDEPHGLATDLSGNTLYVANSGSRDVSVVDLREGREVKRLAAGRGAWGVSRSADGTRILVTNNLPRFTGFRGPLRSEVTVIDARRAQVADRITLEDANLVQGIDVSPDGEFALVTLLRTKNLVPMTRILQGWVVTNGIGILWKDGRVDQLLLDEPENYFADPTDLAVTPDGRYAYVSGGGVNAVAVIDLARMKAALRRATSDERKTLLPNHLGIATEYVLKRIGVGDSPRGLAVSPDGRYLYVADALDDAVSVIDVGRNERTAVIDLGGPREITKGRMGERIFHNAGIAFGGQFSCHTCHPDGGVDGITYDIEADGLGVNPVDNRSLRGILDTAPFKWTGKNPTLSRQCGPRLAVFFTRSDPFTPEEVKAVERYICTIPMNPNRYAAGKRLSPAQRRGKALFERTQTNSGKEIPEGKRCISCHWGPYHTSRKIADVGTRSRLDTQGNFDVPHLTNIYESAPYMHDGRAETLEEIWTRYNPEDAHGVTNDMTKSQLNDLIEYLKRL